MHLNPRNRIWFWPLFLYLVAAFYFFGVRGAPNTSPLAVGSGFVVFFGGFTVISFTSCVLARLAGPFLYESSFARWPIIIAASMATSLVHASVYLLLMWSLLGERVFPSLSILILLFALMFGFPTWFCFIIAHRRDWDTMDGLKFACLQVTVLIGLLVAIGLFIPRICA